MLSFIKSHQKGFNMLLFVLAKGRMMEGFDHDYELFYKILFECKINAMLYVSHCEKYNIMDEWKEKSENAVVLEEFNFKAIVCGTAAEDPGYKEKLIQTRDCMWKVLGQYTSHNSYSLEDILSVIQRVFNFIRKIFGAKASFTLSESKKSEIRNCLEDMGLNEAQIKDLIKEIEK